MPVGLLVFNVGLKGLKTFRVLKTFGVYKTLRVYFHTNGLHSPFTT